MEPVRAHEASGDATRPSEPHPKGAHQPGEGTHRVHSREQGDKSARPQQPDLYSDLFQEDGHRPGPQDGVS